MKLLQVILIFHLFYVHSFTFQLHTESRLKRHIDCYDVQSCCEVKYTDPWVLVYTVECLFEKFKQNSPCFADCIARKFGFLAPSGTIDNKKLRIYIDNQVNNHYWWVKKSARKNIIDKCLISAKEMKSNQNESQKSSCTNLLNPIGHCLFIEAQLLCPKRIIQDGNKCIQLLSYMKTHQSLPPKELFC